MLYKLIYLPHITLYNSCLKHDSFLYVGNEQLLFSMQFNLHDFFSLLYLTIPTELEHSELYKHFFFILITVYINETNKQKNLISIIQYYSIPPLNFIMIRSDSVRCYYTNLNDDLVENNQANILECYQHESNQLVFLDIFYLS